ncbi:MAG: aspartyl/asparaginyl beta-hydroxylase domain-containing protein [Hyphomicrobiales bacterium]|nr:aspartyl/asparaginyl beta-hydroxylase domain-containing protein [Hyphomicrobiales bacterium]
MSSAIDQNKPERPDTLRRPLRKRIKRFGKKMTRRIAGIQSSQSLVPDTPIIGNEHFDFLDDFTDNWQTIRDEVTEILKHREDIPAFQEISPDQYRISKGKNWRTFVLYGFGKKMERNAEQAPVTTRILEQVPNLQTAWFSILAPGYHIPAHTGVTKGILRSHLGLIIPKEQEKCRIRIGDETQVWRPGEIFVFDDTYEHEVWNDTDEERVVLLFDFDRPMRFWGRALNSMFLKLMKLTAFYQEPRKNLKDFEDRYEAAIRRADANLEKLSDGDD